MYAETKNFSFILFIMFVIAIGGTAIYFGAALYQTKRTVAERDRLITEYRERNEQIARINGELNERNQRLEDGIISIREIAGTATTSIRQAIGIISGVKSVLEALEDDGTLRYTGSPAGRNSGGLIDGGFP